MLKHIKSHRYAFIGIFILCCNCLQAFSGDVSLAWDPSVSEGVTGYKVYFGSSSGDYGTPITIPNQTSYTVADLPSGTYYFAVTAFNATGDESGFSNEVSTIVGESATTCDINNDTSVDVIDLQVMINIILGVEPSMDAFDLNGDGGIDVLDLQILNNVVLGLRSCP
jgi:hypothetical protein